MSGILGSLITITTYGVWLRGDSRGWVEDGVTYPPNPELQRADAQRLKYSPFCFERGQLWEIGQSLIGRKQQHILAMTVRTWHIHFVVATSIHSIPDIVKCAKDAVRYGLRIHRPIWGEKYDKRYCYDDLSLERRIDYVDRHNLEDGLKACPWDFIRRDW